MGLERRLQFLLRAKKSHSVFLSRIAAFSERRSMHALAPFSPRVPPPSVIKAVCLSGTTMKLG